MANVEDAELFHEVCGGKYSYSKNEAERVRFQVGKQRDKDMRIYECPKCHSWHLTKKNK